VNFVRCFECSPPDGMKLGLFRIILLILVMIPPPAWADWGYELLFEFERPGILPMAPLVYHGNGNFYGTAVSGGRNGLGTVYQLTPGGVLTTVTSFSGRSGSGPGAAPIAELTLGGDGALYGTTSGGGANGFGLAFKVTTEGAYTNLVDFTGVSGAAKGAVPGALVLHADGLFYGTTQAGGGHGFGTVFSMTAAGAVTTLVEFSGTTGAVKGSMPVGALAVNGTDLYGVTTEGGATNLGTAFKVTTGGTWTGIGEFSGDAGAMPGANPTGGVVLHGDGVLYGVAEFGGANGFGTAFKFTTAVNPVFTVLRHFDDPSGSQPVGSLVEGSDGALYGATSAGGFDGWGTWFRLTTGGGHTVLVDFSGETGASTGSTPRVGLVVGGGGLLYGATSAGGPGNLGVVASVTNGGSYTKLANFSVPLGWTPSGAPVADGAGGVLFPVAEGGDGGGGALVQWNAGSGVALADGLGGSLGDSPDGGLVPVGAAFFGVTATGGGSSRGTAYKYDATNGASLVASFTTTTGSASEGALVAGSDGALYGVSREGGSSARGTVSRLTTTGARTRLASFTGLAGVMPGRSPRGPLALASNGDFYGLAELGGNANEGVLYRISQSGVAANLTEFGMTGPRRPLGGMVASGDGFIYGATSLGGAADAGTLLRVNPVGDAWSVVAEFADGVGTAAGRTPAGELTEAFDGSLWGMMIGGGPVEAGGVYRYATGTGLETVVSFSGFDGMAPGLAGVDPGGGVEFTGGLLPQVDGSVLGVSAGGGNGGGGVVFRLVELSPIQEWKLAELGDFNAPDLEDPDHDGFVNLVEYALGMQPMVADPEEGLEALILSYVEGSRLAVFVPRNPLHSDITVVVESSPDLQNPWTPLATSTMGLPFAGPGYVGGDAATPGVKLVEIRDLTTIVGGSQRFLRVHVTH
jgi:uncharacterized repeat protein (TIGR03803 family)